MIDESLLKSNFIGRDGFRWWIGQIPPVEVWEGQANNEEGGWGNRYKVRILGYHPYSKGDLADNDLPWAGVIIPPTAGTGAANYAQSTRIKPGDIVIGFFLDGDNGQLPMIMGSFGRTKQVPSDLPSEAFVPFTGYTTRVPPPDNTVAKSESNEADKEAQKSPRTASQKVIEKLNSKKKEGELKEIAISSTFGLTEIPADGCADNFVGSVAGTMDNLFAKVGGGGDLMQGIASATEKIQKLSNAPVTASMDSLYESLVPNLQGGLERLFDTTYAATYGPVLAATKSTSIADSRATLAGIAAQKMMINPIKKLQDNLDCLPGKIVGGLGGVVRGLLEDALSNVVNNGDCVTEQFAGSLLNNINDQISSALKAPLGGVSKILSAGTSVKGILGGASNAFQSAGNLLDCNQSDSNCVGQGGNKKWTVGMGPGMQFDISQVYNNVTKNANKDSIKPAGSSAFSNPDCAKPSFCAPPSVNIFGGGGLNASGKAILGNFVDDDPESADTARTASIIGVELDNPGLGYFDAPPIVTFQDPCGSGYGAIARAVVDYDPASERWGQVIAINMITEGENYPVVSDNSDAINSDEVQIGVVEAIIVDGGSGYEDAVISDGNTEYSVTIDNGKIISAIPINSIEITNLPKITVTSSTGSGAFIKPVIGKLPLSPQGEVLQIIDCVT